MLACTAEQAPEAGGPPETQILVRRHPAQGESDYTITAGGCKITWTIFESETNLGVIRHRADCGLTLGEQAPLIARLLRKVMQTGVDAARFRTLSWGRLYPDQARDATMAVRLALAARRSAQWDAARGVPRHADLNGWTRKLANDALIYKELLPVFQNAGLEIRLSGAEKVLVLGAGKLPFFEQLRQAGARAGDKLPFDFQAWFSVRPVSALPAGAGHGNHLQ